MTNYEQLVKALRCCTSSSPDDCDICAYQPFCQRNGTGRERIMIDATAAIEALQAEVERLKDSNDELREAQTYIDHYGDKWMTSAKDVPTSAYNHGYMDGKNEAEQALEPKRGGFEKSLHEMFDSIWDCDINHPIFQDTVGELMEAVLKAYDTVNRAKMEVQE